LLVLALIGLMAAKSMLVQLPPVRPDNNSDQFSAERAASRLEFVLGDQRPHTADTPADDLVRNKIVMLLQSMGIQPIVRDQLACNALFKARGVSCARVRNVIAILGPRTDKAVLLDAHYDSVAVGPGASDDGMGVATLLEVASVLKNRPLKRPLILLFNEGEELGLVGARAFLADPLSRNVDSLINLEARGVRGPANMFETSRPNAAPVALFARAAAHPVANSLSTDVYRLMPNYTDVNSYSERGWLTLNIAPIGNETRYHSPGDELSALDHRTLQHMGDQTLALAEALTARAAPEGQGNRIFMDVSGRVLIALPLAAGGVLLGGLLVGFAWLAWRRGGGGRGAVLFVGTAVLSAAIAWLMVTLIGLARPGMFWRAFPIWTHLATYAAVIAVGTLLVGRSGPSVPVGQLRTGFWLMFVLLGTAIAAVAPGGIIYFLFPPLIVLIGISANRYWPKAEAFAAVLAIAFLYFTWGELLALLEELINQGPMWLFAPLGSLILLPALIEAKALIESVRPREAALTGGALALALWGAAAVAPSYSADRQQRFAIEHITDTTANKAYWAVLNDGAALPSGFGPRGYWERRKLPYSERMRWLTEAPPTARIKPPTAQPFDDPIAIEKGKPRTRTILLRTNGADSIDLIAPEGADIRAAGIGGFVRPFDETAKGRTSISCFGRSCDGASLTIIFGNSDPVPFTLVGARRSLPPEAAPLIRARPKFARPQYVPDETVTLTRIWL
jgi:hypothetical protein